MKLKLPIAHGSKIAVFPHWFAMILPIAWLGLCDLGGAAEAYPVGESVFWKTGSGTDIDWSPLGVNDVANDYTANDAYDFVGSASSPGLYWAKQNDYVFFRMLVDAGTAPNPWTGTHFLLIDLVDQGNDGIDYGFAWDAKSDDNAKHGLEMIVFSTGTTWSTARMDDLDGANASKGTMDINGNARTTDGYVRTTDGISTTNFSTATYVDFAVSWAYLSGTGNTTSSGLGLDPADQWKVTAAAIDNATDHNTFREVMGIGSDLSGSVTDSMAWSTAIPEPSGVLLVGLSCGAGLLRRRR